MPLTLSGDCLRRQAAAPHVRGGGGRRCRAPCTRSANLRARRAAAVAITLLAGASGVFPLSPAGAETAAVGAAQDPRQLVADLATCVLSALERDRLAYRRDPSLVVALLDQVLEPHFDLDYSARLVLGAHWRDAPAESRQRFARALFHTLLRNYAGAVAEWTAERFKVLPLSGDAAALQVTVRTQVMRPDGPFVAVDYRLHKRGDVWQVFDVIVDGVSYVRTYHDDVDTDINQRGLDFAITRLEKAAASAGGAEQSGSPPRLPRPC